MNSSLFFALCVSVTAVLYQVFQRQAAGVNAYLVAIITSAAAIIFGLVFSLLGSKISLTDFPRAKVSLVAIILIGICAFGIDFFTSKAYAAGGSVSLVGPIITSGMVILSAIVGAIFFKEPFTSLQVGGIALMTIGIFLASWGK